jgi:tetratricopeptide (TPR) repeat protein
MPVPSSLVTGPHTIADRLLGLAEAEATGVLVLNRGQVQKRLFLRQGVLVAAESNLREEALGEILVAMGLLGQSRLPTLLAEVKRRGKKMGAVLVDLGWATPEDVLAALGEQVRRRAESCLRWAAEEATFEPSSTFVGGVIEHAWATAPLVFTGLRANASFEELLPVLDAETARYVALTPRFERHRGDFLAVFGPLLPEQIAARTALHDFVLHPEAAVIVEALDTLLVSGLGYLQEGGRAFALPGPAAPAVATDFDSTPGSFKRAPGTLPGQPPPQADPLGAELAFNDGRAAIAAGLLPAAVMHLRHAVALRPDQAAYHAWLGWTLFEIEGEAALPEALDRQEHAVAIDPDSVEGHALLALTLVALGDGPRARSHFERSLALRPEQPEVIDRLVSLHRAAGQIGEVERLYRRVLAALGDHRAPTLRMRLWRELAALFAGPLQDPASAAKAQAMAVRLDESLRSPPV